jgi:hypothetical protein
MSLSPSEREVDVSDVGAVAVIGKISTTTVPPNVDDSVSGIFQGSRVREISLKEFDDAVDTTVTSSIVVYPDSQSRLC